MMGLSLTPSRSWDQSLSASLFPFLESIEVSQHLPCPLEFLNVAVQLCKLLGEDDLHDGVATEDVVSFLGALESFDVRAWAYSFKHSPACESCPIDHESRIHVGEAQRSAFFIFAVRATSQVTSSNGRLAHHLSRLVEHLSFISDTEVLFKATSWPTFIAALETREGSVFSWSLSRLRKICRHLPWGYIGRVIQVLERTKQMSMSLEDRTSSETNWIHALKSVIAQYPVVQ